MIKMIGLDLDGTLLNADQTISKETINHLEKLYAQGITIGIVTGRTYARTCDPLEKNGITPSLGFPHFMLVNERDVYWLEDNEYRLVEDINHEARQEEKKYLPLANKVVKTLLEQVDFPININSEEVQEERGFVQLRFDSEKESRFAENILFDLLADQPLRPVRNTWLIDLRSHNVGKGLTLSKLAQQQNLAPESILVIGDSQNDLCMLNKFVPGTTDNADPEIKSAVLKRNGMVSEYITSRGVGDILKTKLLS